MRFDHLHVRLDYEEAGRKLEDLMMYGGRRTKTGVVCEALDLLYAARISGEAIAVDVGGGLAKKVELIRGKMSDANMKISTKGVLEVAVDMLHQRVLLGDLWVGEGELMGWRITVNEDRDPVIHFPGGSVRMRDLEIASW